jgi:ribonuclease HI
MSDVTKKRSLDDGGDQPAHKRPRLLEVLEVWTDGACSHNQDAKKARAGLGVYFGPGDSCNLSEPLPSNERQTNQRAELLAAIRALEVVLAYSLETRPICLYSDSQYVVKGVQEWLPNWKRKGWRNAKRKPVENQDLWKRLDALLPRISIKWRHVKGHAGNPGNVAADALAVQAIHSRA